MWRRLVTSLFQDTALLKRLLQVKKWCVSWLQEDLGEEKIAKKCFTWAASAVGAGLSKQAQLTPEWMYLRNPSGNPAGMALEGITMDCCDHHLGFEANLWFTMGKCWLFHVIEVRILQSSFWMHGTDTNRDCVCVCPVQGWAVICHPSRVSAAFWSNCSCDIAVLMLEYLDLQERQLGAMDVGSSSKISSKSFWRVEETKAWLKGEQQSTWYGGVGDNKPLAASLTCISWRQGGFCLDAGVQKSL